MLKLTRRQFLQFLSLLPAVAALPDAYSLLLTRSIAEELPEHDPPSLSPFTLVIGGQPIVAKELSVEGLATTIDRTELWGEQRLWHGPISNRLYVTSNDDRCKNLLGMMYEDESVSVEFSLPRSTTDLPMTYIDWQVVCQGHLTHVGLEHGHQTLWTLDLRLSDLRVCATWV